MIGYYEEVLCLAISGTLRNISGHCLSALIIYSLFIGNGCIKYTDVGDYDVVLKNYLLIDKVITLESFQKSLRGTISDIPVVVLRGSNQEIGEAHGELFGGRILQLLNNVIIPLLTRDNKDLWDSWIIPKSRTAVFPKKFEIELAAMLTGIKNRLPNKEDRILFSPGREITLDDLRALNCLSDIVYMDNCSSFSVWGRFVNGGEVICGRNLDWKSISADSPFSIIAREPSEHGRSATIDINVPGIIGASTTMNADGIIFMAHYEKGLPTQDSQRWIPRAIVLRDAIESANVTDSMFKIAELFKDKRVRIGNSTHITLPKHNHPFVVEWDGNRKDKGVTIRLEDGSVIEEAIVCTNHFINRRTEKLKKSNRFLQTS